MPNRVPEQLSPQHDPRKSGPRVNIIPFPHAIFWVNDGTREVPLVFFRPSLGEIAVYDPAHGTGVGECSIKEDVKVVSLVATRMGYRTDGIHSDFSGATGTLVAANGSAHNAVSHENHFPNDTGGSNGRDGGLKLLAVDRDRASNLLLEQHCRTILGNRWNTSPRRKRSRLPSIAWVRWPSISYCWIPGCSVMTDSPCSRGNGPGISHHHRLRKR